MTAVKMYRDVRKPEVARRGCQEVVDPGQVPAADLLAEPDLRVLKRDEAVGNVAAPSVDVRPDRGGRQIAVKLDVALDDRDLVIMRAGSAERLRVLLHVRESVNIRQRLELRGTGPRQLVNERRQTRTRALIIAVEESGDAAKATAGRQRHEAARPDDPHLEQVPSRDHNPSSRVVHPGAHAQTSTTPCRSPRSTGEKEGHLVQRVEHVQWHGRGSRSNEALTHFLWQS